METKKKLLVGLFVGGSLSLFAIGLFLIGSATQLFNRSFHVTADFAKVTGLQVGSKVRVAGMDAGAITVIQVPLRPEGKFRVRFRIVEKLHPIVRRDSVATIQTDGLLGNKFLQVEAGTDGSAQVPDGAAIQAREPFDWDDLMTQVSDIVKTVNVVVAAAQEQLVAALKQVSETAASANRLVTAASPHIKSIIASSDRVAANINLIAGGLSNGQGTFGALLKDEALAGSVKQAVRDTERTVQSLRDTTDSARKIVAQMEGSDIVPEVQQAVQNLTQITRQVREAVEKFQSTSGEAGVAENFQRTLASANEAMSDLSDDTEALKHNFLFRGFFKKRGFYDLSAVSPPEYRAVNFGKGFKQHRVSLGSADLFAQDPKGIELLTDSGKRLLDEAMAEILQFPRNGPLMLEGYATGANASERYLQARRRAARVQTYIIARFHLRAAYVGIVAMGAPSTAASPAGQIGEGVSLVSFYKK